MPENLELKARVRSLQDLAVVARRIGARKQWTRIQRDTYYDVPKGRLKMRESSAQPAELIAYRRPDTRGSRRSRYDVFFVDRPRKLKSMLSEALGVRTVVEKRRTLYLYQNCRIHADRVRGAGTFVEFEVLMTRGNRQASRLLNRMIREFAVAPADVVGASYSDLLLHPTRRKRR